MLADHREEIYEIFEPVFIRSGQLFTEQTVMDHKQQLAVCDVGAMGSLPDNRYFQKVVGKLHKPH